MRPGLITWLLLIFTVTSSVGLAKNLGKIGQVYPIKEMDMVDFIHLRLKQMEQSGELAKINQRMLNQTKQRADRPLPVPDITPTKKYRTWLIDPSITFDQDIKDVEGKLIVTAGTVINPLTRIAFKKALIFYDGDHKKQVAWALKKDQALQGNNKMILVNGSVSAQSNILKKRIYFDQHGRLTTKFKIQHTPAIVTQAGLKLKVEELVP